MISNVSVPYIIVDTDTVQISISVTEQIITRLEGDNIIISILQQDKRTLSER